MSAWTCRRDRGNFAPARTGDGAVTRYSVLFGALVALVLAGSSRPALAQTGLTFNGTSQYVTFGQATSTLGASNFTLEVWFKRTAAGAATSTGTGGITAVPLVTKGRAEADGTTADCNYFFGIRDSAGVANLCADYEEGAGQASPGLNHPAAGLLAISNNVWYHAAVTFDGTAWRFYLNGVLDRAVQVGTGRLPRNDSAQHAGLATAMTTAGAAAGFFAGSLDEARIWNAARTQCQIQDAMNLEVTSGTGLLGRWGLNDGSTLTAVNSVVTGPNGTLTPSGTPPTWTTGMTLPGVPSALSANAPDATQVQLTWTDGAISEASYDIERSTSGSGGPFSLLANVAANSVSYTDNTVVADQQYCYRVRANFCSVPSNYTNTACATPVTPVPPAAPSGLAASAPAFDQVTLSWTDNSTNETGFELERSTTGSGGPFSLLVTLGSNAAGYTDTGRSASTEYCYRVRATNAAGQSAYAGPECATTPAEPCHSLDLVPSTYVTFGDATALHVTSFTVETWFRLDAAGTATSTGTGGWGSIVPLVTKGRGEAETPANLNMNYFLGIRSDGRLAADFEEPSGPNHPIGGVTAISTGTWYHAAVAFDAVTGRYTLYLNGLVENDTTLTGGVAPASTSIQHAGLGSAMTSTGAAAGFLDGVLDEVRVWNVARSGAQIAGSANSEISTAQTGLVGRWSLNEASGTAIASSAGTSVPGTITGAGFTHSTSCAPFNLAGPAAPSALLANATAWNSVHLTWTDNSSTESNFYVERSTAGSGGPFTPLATLAANTVAYDDNGLSASTPYCYRVHAGNAFGNSADAGPSCATTPEMPTPPAAPSGTAASAISSAQVTVSWTDNSSNETAFELERSTSGSGGPFSLLVTLGAGVVTYDDLTVSGLTEYCYRVRATNSAGPSGYDGPVCATTPAEVCHSLDLVPNTYVGFGNPAALGLQQFTIECWFRRDATGTSNTTGSSGLTAAIPLVTKGAPQSDGSNVDANWILALDVSTPANPRLAADFEDFATGANHPITGSTTIVTGQWYHAAATYDGTTWQLYLNGQPEASLSVGQMPRYDSIQQAGLGTMLTSTGTALGFFDGVLDEVRVWNYARTALEVEGSANSEITTPQSGLVARWSLNEASGTAIASSAGTSVPGTITGAGYTHSTECSPFNAAPPAPPNAPSDLVVYSPIGTSVHLDWADNSNNETGFEIRRSSGGGPYTLIATTAANATALASYDDNGVMPLNDYCYQVRAVRAALSSADVGPGCVTTGSLSEAALRFAGTDAYVRVPNQAVLQLSQFTLEAWIRRDGAGVGTNTGTSGIPDAIPLIAKGRAEAEAAAQDINFLFGIRASDGVLCADFEEGAAGASPSLNHPIAGSTAIGTGTWHHVAATYDGTTWRLYLDGQLDGSPVVVGQPPAAASTVALALASALTSTDVASGFFDGVMDEVRIWNVARTQAQIQTFANAQLTSPQAGLVARWSLDEGSGTAVNPSAATVPSGSVLGSDYAWVGPAPFDLPPNQPPAQAVLSAPANNATEVSQSPTLDVLVSDPDSPQLSVSFYGRAVGGPPGPDFSLIGLPDTQYYTGQLNGGTSAMLDAQTQWVFDQRVPLNIAYVGQFGDCVEHGDQFQVEWIRAALRLRDHRGSDRHHAGRWHSVRHRGRESRSVAERRSQRHHHVLQSVLRRHALPGARLLRRPLRVEQ